MRRSIYILCLRGYYFSPARPEYWSRNNLLRFCKQRTMDISFVSDKLKSSKDMFFLLYMFWYVQIMKNHVFCWIFFCVNVCEIRLFHLLHLFIRYTMYLFCIEMGMSKEQIVILPFAHYRPLHNVVKTEG